MSILLTLLSMTSRLREHDRCRLHTRTPDRSGDYSVEVVDLSALPDSGWAQSIGKPEEKPQWGSTSVRRATFYTGLSGTDLCVDQSEFTEEENLPVFSVRVDLDSTNCV